MRTITKTLPLTIALFGSLAATQVASAAVSGNLGFVSQYIFRGIIQTPASGSGSAGIDYSHDSGFYAGTWAGSVESGLEYDLYAGFGNEYQGLSYDLNYTTYNYTDTDWDDTYAEFNIGLGYGPISVGYADGTHDIPNTSNSEDYTVTTVSASKAGFTLLYGDYGKDFTGSWYEFGYSTTVGDFDTGINYIKSDKDLDDTDYMIFSLGKSFDIM
jgi:uncharacterized protein (TIGR02001 family)